MITLTCAFTSQPIPLRHDRFSSAVPITGRSGCRVRTIDGEAFVATESSAEVISMLSAAESAGSSERAATSDILLAAKDAATVFRRAAAMVRTFQGNARIIDEMRVALGVSVGAHVDEEFADALLTIADRLYLP